MDNLAFTLVQKYLKNFYYIFFTLAVFFTSSLHAQFNGQSNLVTKKIAAKGIIQLSDKVIVPQSVFIQNLDSTFYSINSSKASLLWLKKPMLDSVWVTFRTFNFAFNTIIQRFNYDSIQYRFLTKPFTFNTNNKSNLSNGTFDFGNMQYNGSFGRSLSFGNNQDAVFNSQLNLQISGMLADSVEIAAAITDNNIPIQPDGTTQQLNEFDRILIQIKKKNWEVNLGDIDIRENQNYFLKFYKRLQGISYQQQYSYNHQNNNQFTFAGAIAKGKFTRNIFQGLEGNQGPYRLQGTNNEFYLIILSNSERVFIDGELMQRGEDQDYVINYNTAEITFTPRRMITKDKRIQVEFEYADRNFLNSVFYAENKMQINKRLSFTVAAYTNADAKNSTINQNLDAPQKQFLADIGDSVQNAFYKFASIDSFSVSKILYAKKVNPVNPLWDSIYVYSINPAEAKYNLNFIEVGINKGDYINFFNSANGKVFQYISPINGVKQGNYEAATFLVTPKKQQVITVASKYQIAANTTLESDLALSNYDVNTFSSKDKINNKGYAAKFLLSNNKKISQKLQINSAVGYEWVDQNFKPVERLRSVEFSRDWGLPILPQIATEHLPKAIFEIKNSKTNALIKYNVDGYLRSDNFNAVRNSLLIKNENSKSGFSINANASMVSNSTPADRGNFVKVNTEVAQLLQQLNMYQVGFTYLLEKNLQRNNVADTLTPLSFLFENIGFFIKSNTAQKNNWAFTYFTRQDQLPQTKQLVLKDKSNNYNFTAQLLQNNNHQFRLNITYRELIASKNFHQNYNSEKSLLGRFEYTINEWNGFITGNTLYELGSGQEQRRDFSYIEVPAGRGEFTWIDYNNDGIPQLNEFEIALFPDQAKFIKVFTPTNQFIKANYNQFNYNININPRVLSNAFHNKKIKNFVTRLTAQSSMQIGKKIIATDYISANPFKGNIDDTALISLNNIYNNTLSFNRFSSIWGVDISNVRSFSKALLTYGFESRTVTNWQIRLRGTIKKQYTFEVIQKLSNNSLATPKFANRNFDLAVASTEPKVTYTYATKFRLLTSFLYTTKTNALVYGGETSNSNALNVEAKYNAVNNTSLLAKFTYSNISFAGLPNTSVSYIMLDGLLPGKNFLWTVELTKRLGNNLELSFNYEGRKPAETRTINIGRATLRALL